MRKRWMAKAIKMGIPFLLAVIFLAGIALPGTTASGQAATPTLTPGSQMTFGQVVSLAPDKTSFVMQTDVQTQVTVNVNQRTTYTVYTVPASSITTTLNLLEFLLGSGAMPTGTEIAGVFANLALFAKTGSFNDIVVGDIVSVTPASGTATTVNIIKYTGVGKIQGNITAVSATSITITPASGSAVTINWDKTSRFLLSGVITVQTGLTATAFYNTTSNAAIIATIKAPTATPTPAPSASPGQ